MKELDIQDIKIIQISILDYFDEFCKKNDIRYWLDYGTLLGAVRHKGFIPWDDDIDIGMLREDYKRAEILFNQQSNGLYAFKTPINDNTYCYPFGKLIRTDTVLYEYGKEGITTGVYIDVFPYDNSPKSKRAVKRMFKKRDFLGRLRRLQLPMRAGLSKRKRILYRCGATIIKIVPNNTINALIDKNARKYSKRETGIVSSFTDTYENKYLIVPKSLFRNLEDIEFEGKKYPAPKDYDFWLSSYYGDYMKLPPIEQRVKHHVYNAFYL